MPSRADTTPTKRFFVEMITRDISMEDAILDLIDNSIDSFIRTRGVALSAQHLQATDRAFVLDPSGRPVLGVVKVELTSQRFRIEDRTGGISREKAEREVFRFGADADHGWPSLGVYGIGLKRAIFKLGRNISIESRTLTEGFSIQFDAKLWEKEKGWSLPMSLIGGAGTLDRCGTTIEITDLYDNVQTKITDGTAERRLFKHISETYPFFLERMIHVELNGVRVPPTPVPFGTSNDVTPATTQFKYDAVEVTLAAGLMGSVQGDWNADRAGWYIICNGRVVVSADRTELTGWGAGGPIFHSKYRGFVGLAFLFSEDPVQLPWTTTKRGINQESPVFISARKQMQLVARPVISFLNSLYPTDAIPEPTRRAIVEQVHQADIKQVLSTQSSFSVRMIPPVERQTTKIQYDALISDVERIRKCLRKPRMSAKSIGEHTFKYFLEMECAE